MAANEVSVLQTLFSTLVECLNVETVKPYLVSNQTINLEECEELRVGSGPQLTTQRAVAEKLIMILKRKPRCASQLLDALENANVQNPDTGHHLLMAQLKEKLSGVQVVNKVDSTTLPDGLNGICCRIVFNSCADYKLWVCIQGLVWSQSENLTI